MKPLAFADAAEWEAWLVKNHATAADAWLLIGKKGSKQTLLAIGDALDVALCFGWIDSQRKGHDDDSYLQRYSRRGAKSPWSKLNVDRVAALTKSRRMRPSGVAEVDAAKADGRWDVAYVAQSEFRVPRDVTVALRGNAKAAFERLDKSAQYAALLPVLKATTPQLRSNRLARFVEKLGCGTW